jgi:hypothetical protein
MENPPDSAGVVHLHGALIDPKDDGFSMDWITRGQKIQYHYTNEQLPLTMWYHDHVMTRTRVNVYAGLAGTPLRFPQLHRMSITAVVLGSSVRNRSSPPHTHTHRLLSAEGRRRT